MIKKFLAVMMVSVLALAMVGCAAPAPEPTPAPEPEAAPTSVKVKANVGDNVYEELDIPFDPKKVVVLNYATVDIMDQLGIGDRIVGMIKVGSVPAHLQKYVDNEKIVNLGGMKDIDMEAVASLAPDVIFSSDRTASKQKDFEAIAPTMSSSVAYKMGFYEGWKHNVDNHAKIFGLEDKAESFYADYEKRIADMKKIANGQTCLLNIFAGGKLNSLGDEGRIALITNDIGFTNLNADKNVNHGDAGSYETLLEVNPEWMFNLDKDTAVGAEGATLAEDQMDNDVVKQTQAFKNDTIVYLQPGDVWYMADGGIQAMDIMLSDLEKYVK